MRPTNDELVVRELEKEVKKLGSIKLFAASINYSYINMRHVMCGVRDVSPRMAAVVGYELKWVKKQG
jgi:hypothetical protein